MSDFLLAGAAFFCGLVVGMALLKPVSIDASVFAKAASVCQVNEGADKLNVKGQQFLVTCRNGAQFDISNRAN